MNDGQRRPSAPPKPIGMGIGGGSSQFEHTLLNYRGTGRMKSCKCIQPFRWNKRTVRCNDHEHSFACCIICFWACWFHLQGNGKCPGPFRKSLYEQRLGLLASLIFRCSYLTNRRYASSPLLFSAWNWPFVIFPEDKLIPLTVDISSAFLKIGFFRVPGPSGFLSAIRVCRSRIALRSLRDAEMSVHRAAWSFSSFLQ